MTGIGSGSKTQLGPLVPIARALLDGIRKLLLHDLFTRRRSLDIARVARPPVDLLRRFCPLGDASAALSSARRKANGKWGQSRVALI